MSRHIRVETWTDGKQKVRAYLAANPESAQTLESLLAHEKTKFPNAKDRSTTSGLMWLLRGLKFTAIGKFSELDDIPIS
jgi:hypothetical protein